MGLLADQKDFATILVREVFDVNVLPRNSYLAFGPGREAKWKCWCFTEGFEEMFHITCRTRGSIFLSVSQLCHWSVLLLLPSVAVASFSDDF